MTANGAQWHRLSRRRQLVRLRRLGRTALAAHGLVGAQLTLLRHDYNTTFRVDADDGSYVLRISRRQFSAKQAIESEMSWLIALRRETTLVAPEPVVAPQGSFVVMAADTGVPEQRACALLRWLDGRFVDRGLAPAHLRRVGIMAAHLHAHTDHWAPPPGFVRPRVDTLTERGKLDSIAGPSAAGSPGDHPTVQDAERARRLAGSLISADASALVARALELVWATTRSLANTPESFGLIHGDLHYENFLFHRGQVRAIDFDDCGWGFHLYDLAITLWELEERQRYDQLRDALLRAYAEHRRLPDGYLVHLSSLVVLRRLQMLMWALESRAHPTFRAVWQTWAREELDAIGAALSS